MDNNTIQAKSGKRGLIYIDLLRIIAIYLVFFSHSGKYGCDLFASNSTSGWYWLYVFAYILSICAVPLFFMISGALLIDREESMRELFTKRVLRFFITLTLVSMIYYGYCCSQNRQPFAVIYFFMQIFDHSAYSLLWFLYAYLGFLVMLPLLRRLARAMSDSDFIYLTAAHIAILGALPVGLFLWSRGQCSLNSQFTAPLVTVTSVFYVLMGYFLEKRLDTKCFTSKNALLLTVASIAAIALSAGMIQYTVRLTEQGLGYAPVDFSVCLMAVPTLTMFFCVKLLCQRVSIGKRMTGLIRFFGSAAFGAYLLEYPAERLTAFIYEFLHPYIGAMPASIIWLAVAFVLAALTTAVLKLIPGVKKLL